ncbi:MAG: helix-turn-helix domain-containing protein [Thermoplasmata archaeon]|nr:helix-turn-helix domain-containing protein [Thermoplasmata archaeon]
MRVAPPVFLSPEERAGLLRRRTRGGPSGERADLILLAAEGLQDLEIGRRRGRSRQSVGRWRRRFLAARLAGLADRPSSGRRGRVPEEDFQAIVRATVARPPPGGRTWSTRALAREFHVSHMTVRRVWDAYGIRPRRFDAVPPRADPVSTSVPWDLVGLELHGPWAWLAMTLHVAVESPARPDRDGAELARRELPSSGLVPWTFDRVEFVGGGPSDTRSSSDSAASELLRFLGELDQRLADRPAVRVLATPPHSANGLALRRWKIRHPQYEIVVAPDLPHWRGLAEAELARVGRAAPPPRHYRGRVELSESLTRSIVGFPEGSGPFRWMARKSDIDEAEAAYRLRYELAVTGHPGFKGPLRPSGPVPPGPDLAEKRRRSARRILREYLRVRAGERVTIEAWTESLDYGNAFVLESLRLGARPLLLYQDEPTYWAATTEVPAKALAAMGDHRKAALERTDAFVTFFGPSDRERFHSLPRATRFRLGEYEDTLYQTAAKAGARSVQMAIGRVSEASARMYSVDLEGWRHELLDATLVDPKELRDRGRRVARRLSKGHELRIVHANGTDLRLRLRGARPVVSDGTVGRPTAAGNWSLVTLPAGVATVAVDETFAEGTFRANVRSSGGLSDSVGDFSGGRWTFAGGRLTSFRYDAGQDLFAQSYGRAREGRDRPAYVSIGLNERIANAPLLEDQGLGTISMHLGRNEPVGGRTRSDWWAWLFLRGGDLLVDGSPVVRDGRLAE